MRLVDLIRRPRRSTPAALVGPSAVRRRISAGAALMIASMLSLAACGGPSSYEASAAAPHGSATVGSGGQPLARSGSPTPQSASGLPVLGGSLVVERDDVGDPYVLTVPPGTGGDGKTSYVLYWTTDWRSNVPTAVSSDLVHWRRVADSLPVLPSWAVPSVTMTWGPSVHRFGRTWVLYFSTRDAASHLQCIGRATATTPTGPFTDRSPGPLLCQTSLGGDIDPSVVTDRAGRSSLLWKSDGNAIGVPVGLWVQPLTASGLSLTGAPTLLIRADQRWEHGIIEGPAMLAATRGGWWLFYSGGTWQSDTYDTGVAWCRTISGPCRHTSDTPLLASTATAVSPGGFDTFVDGRGRLWASYSAFPSRPADTEAAMAMDRVLEIAQVVAH